MTPAEELRRAAQTLRQRAEAATPGPWTAPFLLDDWPVRSADDYAVADANEPDAAYIASLHPLVGLAIADWLDHEAGFAQAAQEGGPRAAAEHIAKHGLVVARLINDAWGES